MTRRWRAESVRRTSAWDGVLTYLAHALGVAIG